MKNIKQKITLAISLCTLAFSAHAAKPGVYMGIGAGYSNLENFSNIEKDKENNLGGKLFFGYNFNKYFGVEVSYSTYGETRYATYFKDDFYNDSYVLDYKLKTFSTVGKFYFPLEEQYQNNYFDIYMLLGIANASVDVKINSNSYFYASKRNSSNSAIVGVFGFGVNYNINSNITTGLEYTFTGLKSDDSDGGKGIPKADLVTLNLIYKI